jgi:hypothetical protein
MWKSANLLNPMVIIVSHTFRMLLCSTIYSISQILPSISFIVQFRHIAQLRKPFKSFLDLYAIHGHQLTICYSVLCSASVHFAAISSRVSDHSAGLKTHSILLSLYGSSSFKSVKSRSKKKM